VHKKQRVSDHGHYATAAGIVAVSDGLVVRGGATCDNHSSTTEIAIAAGYLATRTTVCNGQFGAFYSSTIWS